MNLRFHQCHRPAKRARTREPLRTAWLQKKTVPIKDKSTSTTIVASFNNGYRFLWTTLTGIRGPVREWLYQVANTFLKDSWLKTH
jgi:hypothetical protein